MKTALKLLLLSFLSITVALTTSCSKDGDKAAYKNQYNKIAKVVAQGIPDGSRVALNLVPQETSGLPEAFLKKLMAEFSGAFIQASDSRFTVINRNDTEQIWKEAAEFNNQDISKLTKSSGADVMVVISPKTNSNGIDLSVTASSLKEENMGNVLASSSELIPMDLKAEIGVDVNNIDKKIDKIADIIDKEGAAKSNSLTQFFKMFAKDDDLLALAKVYQTGCEKPVRLESVKINKDGFRVRCELYENGLPVVEENIAFDKFVNIDLIKGGRSFVDAAIISAEYPTANMSIPKDLDKYTTLLACQDAFGVLSDYQIYRVSIPDGRPFFVSHSRSCGASSCWNILTLAYNQANLEPRNSNSRLLKPGERSKEPGSPFVCN